MQPSLACWQQGNLSSPSVLVSRSLEAGLSLADCITLGNFQALVEGLPAEWTMHIIVPIHKSGDPLDLGNDMTIMIGHTLANLYGVLEAGISSYAEGEGLRAPGQTGFRRPFSTIDHIFTLRCLIDQAKAQKRRLHWCFVDFCKAFDTVSRDRLFQCLLTLGVP
ncbi:hypothetical protein L7F22_008021 [Adiantum nelumboides]|nr:hypothetical protein [Adiantum nelumboides]